MLFHTWTFAVFFVVAYAGYLILRKTRLRNPWLLGASYVFYGWWDPRYLLLIARCTIMDWGLVVLMSRTRSRALRRLWLIVSIGSSLGVLATFKYLDQLIGNINSVLAGAGSSYAIREPTWLLPVGISFFTFQSLSYVIDYYRGRVPLERDIVRYGTFVALFPQLVAGPIERASNLLPQLRTPRRVTLTGVTDGASMFLVGLFKKLALADYLGLYVDSIYDTPAQQDPAALLLATFAFGWQIYFDFSAYTDMARGIARAMGLRLMRNFDHPYLATSLRDFWRRWHISLSTWFRDYVYIPLGGSRRGTGRTYLNLVATMLICGLWHGASWTFAIWGALHAAGQAATRELERSRFYNEKVPRPVRQALVFCFVTFAWIFFRARSLSDAWLIVRRIVWEPCRDLLRLPLPVALERWGDSRLPLLAAGLIAAVWVYQYLHDSRARRLLAWAPVRVAMVVFMILYLAVVPGTEGKPFIYFRF